MDEEFSKPKEPDSQSAGSLSEPCWVSGTCTASSWKFLCIATLWFWNFLYSYWHCGFVALFENNLGIIDPSFQNDWQLLHETENRIMGPKSGIDNAHNKNYHVLYIANKRDDFSLREYGTEILYVTTWQPCKPVFERLRPYFCLGRSVANCYS